MAVAPPLPTSIDPKDMKWVRWITEKAQQHDSAITLAKSNAQSASQQAASAHTKVANVIEKTAAQEAVNPSMPVGPPQTPTAPTLSTDHGTVTIRWDGQVLANLNYTPQPGDDPGSASDPAIGFNHVNAYRATSSSGPWTIIGGSIGHIGSLVDTNVVVGTTYYYHLVTTDNLGATSTPSAAASITVVGVDLGTLATDVTNAISAANAAGVAGQNAAAAASTAASSAASQAATALANAATAQTAATNANTAATNAAGLAAGKSTVTYSNTAPTGDATVLWINTTGGANTPNRWNGSAWVVITDKAATDAAAAAAAANTAAGNAQTTANTAVTNAANAQGTADSALTAANGKNKVIYSASAASGTTGYINGDLWFQTVGGVVTGQWQFNSGAWVSQTVSGTLVASGINAGNITAGSISSARIAANTISASQMIAGTITAASGILADAVITSAKIADLAVSDAKIATLTGSKIIAGSITTGKFQAGAITTNDIAAGSIDTNRLSAGAITADKLSLGAVPQTGTDINRVPAPVTNSTYWSKVVAGTTAGFRYRAATASAAGLVVSVSGTMSLTAQQIQIPVSRKVAIALTYSPATLTGYIDWYDAAATLLSSTSPVTTGTYSAPVGAVYYEVRVVNTSASATVTITNASVFEVIGNDGTVGQAAQLSPAGLQLFDANGLLALDMTTNASQYFSVVDNTGSEPDTVAAIDQLGNAAFTEVSSDNGFDIQGQLLTDVNAPDSLFSATPNGGAWNPSTPLLDRLARGVIYDVTWDSLDGYVVAAGKNSLRIAQDNFILEDGRQYMINVHTGGLQMDNTGGANNIYLELQISTTPIADITTGVNIFRGVVFKTMAATWSVQIPIFSASAAVSTIAAKTSLNNRVLPAGIPIYWQLDASQGGTAASWSLSEFGYARGLTVIDLGANDIMRPNNGADNLPNVSNFVQIGSGGTATAGSGSTGTTATSKTVTFTAKSSRTFNNNGSSIVSGTGQYTNGSAMYFGYGNSPMGSWFGNFQDSGGHSLASVVGGKTVTAAVLTVKNTYTAYSSGASVQFGTGSITSAPATLGAPSNNVWSTTFTNGSSKSITLNSTVRSGLSSGSVGSFQMGVSGSSTNYSYFHGASQSYPPTLKITYH